ncbi:glycosyltransferase family 4 protein [Thermodesulfobacteriota bacterium]
MKDLSGKIRSLLVTTGYPPEHSGSGNRLHQLYCRMKIMNRNLEWKVITKIKNFDLLERKKLENIEILSIKHRNSKIKIIESIAAIIEILWIKKLVKKGLFEGIDLIHCAGWSWMTYYICRSARKRNIPIIRELTSIGDGGLSKGPGGRMIRKTNQYADLLVAISPALEDAVRMTGAKNKIWCRPNPVDISIFHCPNAAERHEGREIIKKWFPKIKENDIVILHVGRFRPLKNQLFLCKVLSRLSDRFYLAMVGPSYKKDEDYIKSIKQFIDRNGIQDHIYLDIGLKRNVDCIMQGSDIFVFPSKKEGLGNVMLEALSTGMPVVANRLQGVTDWIINHGKNGALCELSVESFKEGILISESLIPLREKIARESGKSFSNSKIDRNYLEHIFKLKEFYQG